MLSGDELNALNAQRQRYAFSPDIEREQHERSMQQQEQNRRQYDSDTARMGQEKKYGVLQGLVKNMGGGYGGYVPQSRLRGFTVANDGTTTWN